MMNKREMKIWGRDFDIELVYDCYAGEEILDTQVAAYDQFMEKAVTLLDSALLAVKQYCVRVNRAEITEDTITNIFKYVKPKSLFIKRTTDGERKVALLCAYKFNPDDGMAIVFKNESLLEIGTGNIV